ncbi:MAG: hypothetical protein ACLU3I_18385 [Acutalibacteraceae bacterium]
MNESPLHASRAETGGRSYSDFTSRIKMDLIHIFPGPFARQAILRAVKIRYHRALDKLRLETHGSGMVHTVTLKQVKSTKKNKK